MAILSKDGRKIKCGDVILNHFASIDNPLRVGVVIVRGTRTGKLNNGPFLMLADLEGKTWEIGPDNDRLEIVGEISLP